MKPFTKRLALVIAVAFVALCCWLAPVYITTTFNWWASSNGFVQLIVNTNYRQASFTVDTNTLRVGINTNNSTFGTMIRSALPPTNVTTSPAPTANTTGALIVNSSDGGDTTIPTTGIGGIAGRTEITAGRGGFAPLATTNATGGAGGTVSLLGGSGGASSGVATNATTGGAGGTVTLMAGNGGGPSTPSTNTVGGAGGGGVFAGGDGGTPSSGWARKGGNGGAFTVAGGLGASGVRTNGGDGGPVSMTGGGAGGVSGSAGNAGKAGIVELLGGGGAVGIAAGTNSDGANVFIAGGAPGSGAVPGNVVLARTSTGLTRGAGVQIGPLIAGGSATITNVLGAAASLDFPSTVAGTFSELTVSVTGVTSNNVAVALSVPWESAQTGGAFSTFNSNDVIYVRFINNQLVSAIDPAPGTFTVVGFRIR